MSNHSLRRVLPLCLSHSFLCRCVVLALVSCLYRLVVCVLVIDSSFMPLPSCLFPLAFCLLRLSACLIPLPCCLCVVHTPNMIPHVPFHLCNFRPMPKVRQTLLQAQECLKREQRLRTEARCAQLAAQAKSRVTVRDNLEEISDDEDNTSIEQHGKVHYRERREIRLRTEGRGGPLVAEGKLIVTVLVNHQVISDDEHIVHIEQDGNVPPRLKGWKPTIHHLTRGFLLLLAANCLVLLYFFVYKANSV